ncbi:L-serine_dehydratase [Hexamita inflata]|uniref:L-serine dehydratase n=1 Tax=Hexamita inflata TaxID=28002 RepID=A0AA86TLN3_9EUKA|nr:L-serine dehydratase [Hexamita inflata]
MFTSSESQKQKNERILAAVVSSPHYVPPHRRLDSLRTLYKIGSGPSSSHTMGPKKAAQMFKAELEQLKCEKVKIEVTLYGSLAQTGSGHRTDYAILQVLGTENVELIWEMERRLLFHTNGLLFKAIDKSNKQVILEKVYYSIGGGILEYGQPADTKTLYPTNKNLPTPAPMVYDQPALYAPCNNFHDHVEYCLKNHMMLDKMVYIFENRPILKKLGVPENLHESFFKADCPNKKGISENLIQTHLLSCWKTMKSCVEDGLNKTHLIETSQELEYPRTAAKLYQKALKLKPSARKDALLIQSFALAVSEQNGSATHDVVTSPTCGACGVLPGILYFYYNKLNPALKEFKNGAWADQLMVSALAVGGVIGNVCRANASISGAEAGCQAEVGVAEAMAAAAATYIEMKAFRIDGEKYSLREALQNIEWAARNSLKNKLGLTCDPIKGLVIDPCIQRNGSSALTAHASAQVALAGVFDHLTSFDSVVKTMMDTGKDMLEEYRETGKGGLAINYTLDADAGRDLDYVKSEAYNQFGNDDIEDM